MVNNELMDWFLNHKKKELATTLYTINLGFKLSWEGAQKMQFADLGTCVPTNFFRIQFRTRLTSSSSKMTKSTYLATQKI